MSTDARVIVAKESGAAVRETTGRRVKIVVAGTTVGSVIGGAAPIDAKAPIPTTRAETELETHAL